MQLDFETRASVYAKIDQTSYDLLFRFIDEKLFQILRQEIDSLSIMIEDDRLKEYYRI